jgi:hypothetical protein
MALRASFTQPWVLMLAVSACNDKSALPLSFLCAPLCLDTRRKKNLVQVFSQKFSLYTSVELLCLLCLLAAAAAANKHLIFSSALSFRPKRYKALYTALPRTGIMSHHRHAGTPNFNSEVPGPWQLRLETFCSSNGMRAPIWHTASDRRGMSGS